MLWRSSWRRIRYYYNHLKWPLMIMGFIHLTNVFHKEVVITFRRLWEEHTQDEAQPIIREDGSNWRSSAHDSKKIPQAMRNIKNYFLEEPLIHISIWIRNDAIMNEEDDKAEGSRRILPMKQINISIQLSFHDIIFLWISSYSVHVLCMIECLH